MRVYAGCDLHLDGRRHLEGAGLQGASSLEPRVSGMSGVEERRNGFDVFASHGCGKDLFESKGARALWAVALPVPQILLLNA